MQTLFNVKAVVFDVGLHSCIVHESVVFLGAISGVGNCNRGKLPVTVKERVEEWYECQRVGRIGEQYEAGYELVLGGDLQVVSRLGLTVVHGVLFHLHERGVGIGLRHGVAFTDMLQAVVVFLELVTEFPRFLYLIFLLTAGFLLLLVCRFQLG